MRIPLAARVDPFADGHYFVFWQRFTAAFLGAPFDRDFFRCRHCGEVFERRSKFLRGAILAASLG